MTAIVVFSFAFYVLTNESKFWKQSYFGYEAICFLKECCGPNLKVLFEPKWKVWKVVIKFDMIKLNYIKDI